MYHLIAIFILTMLLSTTASLSLHFGTAQDFYHELGQDAMEFLFRVIPLNTKHLQMLGQLLADERYNIQEYYNRTCWLMNYDRTVTLLNLIRDRKDLEMLLLGLACLHENIIRARETLPSMWPPTGFPLLVTNLHSHRLPTSYIKDILDEALNQPEWWQSDNWKRYVDWNEMDNLSFWRMISPRNDNRDALPYLIKSHAQASYHTRQDLEALLMKSIRIMGFDENLAKVLEKNSGMDPALDNFSHLKDEWSIKVIVCLKQMYSNAWRHLHFPNLLLDSELLQLAIWKDHPIHTGTNNILELFTVAFPHVSWYTKQDIKQAFSSFLDAISDWSCVRPLVLADAINSSNYNGILYYDALSNYLNRILTNPTALFILPEWLIRYSKNLKAHKHHVKTNLIPLKDQFTSRARGYRPTMLDYTKLLYEEWAKDRVNWPGFHSIHEQINQSIRRVFQSEVCKHRDSREYDRVLLDMAFESIRFDAMNRVPSKAIPSTCFLQALLYYEKNGFIDWIKISREVGEECIFPVRVEERASYELALKSANLVFFRILPYLPKTSANIIQALIRGDDIQVERVDEPTSSIIALSL